MTDIILRLLLSLWLKPGPLRSKRVSSEEGHWKLLLACAIHSTLSYVVAYSLLRGGPLCFFFQFAIMAYRLLRGGPLKFFRSTYQIHYDRSSPPRRVLLKISQMMHYCDYRDYCACVYAACAYAACSQIHNSFSFFFLSVWWVSVTIKFIFQLPWLNRDSRGKRRAFLLF